MLINITISDIAPGFLLWDSETLSASTLDFPLWYAKRDSNQFVCAHFTTDPLVLHILCNQPLTLGHIFDVTMPPAKPSRKIVGRRKTG